MTAIVGGSKVSSKIEVLENLISTCDELIIGGGMANTFVKAQGGSTGASLVEEDLLDTARGIIEKVGLNGYMPYRMAWNRIFSSAERLKSRLGC